MQALQHMINKYKDQYTHVEIYVIEKMVGITISTTTREKQQQQKRKKEQTTKKTTTTPPHEHIISSNKTHTQSHRHICTQGTVDLLVIIGNVRALFPSSKTGKQVHIIRFMQSAPSCHSCVQGKNTTNHGHIFSSK